MNKILDVHILNLNDLFEEQNSGENEQPINENVNETSALILKLRILFKEIKIS